jgi:ferredoxin-NADP reductase
MLWRFLDGRRWWQAHPFSLSLAPNGRHLRLTVKGIGDFTSRLAGVRPGTPVLVEGPFGRFSARERTRQCVLLVAGGIGITPLRAMAEQMVGEGADVVLLYRCRRPQDAVLKNELDWMARAPNLRVEYLVGQQGPRRTRAADPLRAAGLRQLVPDVEAREVYVCGPPGMRRVVVESLRRLGVGEEQIHTEAFRL